MRIRISIFFLLVGGGGPSEIFAVNNLRIKSILNSSGVLGYRPAHQVGSLSNPTGSLLSWLFCKQIIVIKCLEASTSTFECFKNYVLV